MTLKTQMRGALLAGGEAGGEGESEDEHDDAESEEEYAMSMEGVAAAGDPMFITMPDGFTIHAQTWRANSPVGVVLYCHGWQECIDSLAVRRIAYGLNAKRISVVAYDHDMHGKSMGIWDSCHCCCAGNVYPLTTGSMHCVEMAKVVVAEHQLPFVLAGHSLGGGTSLLSTERIAAMCREEGADFKGAIYFAPGSNVDCAGSQADCCCPLVWPMSKICCLCCPTDEPEAQATGVPGEPNLAARLIHFKGSLKFLLPESWGGFARPEWWAEHNGGVPYTIISGSVDEVIKVPESQEMHDAAPYGGFEMIDGAGHDLFNRKSGDFWKQSVEMFAQKALEYFQSR